MLAMRRAGDGPASSHQSAEGNGGTGRDDHFALMSLGDHVEHQRQAPLSNEAMPIAKRRGGKAAKTAAVTGGGAARNQRAPQPPWR
jgi:hypothetical protein